MVEFTVDDVRAATRFLNWDELVNAPVDTEVSIRLHGEFASLVLVFSKAHNDSDYDEDLTVVVEVHGRYFRKTGWANIGSHCYGEYGPSWNDDLTEVKPKIVRATDWITV